MTEEHFRKGAGNIANIPARKIDSTERFGHEQISFESNSFIGIAFHSNIFETGKN